MLANLKIKCLLRVWNGEKELVNCVYESSVSFTVYNLLLDSTLCFISRKCWFKLKPPFLHVYVWITSFFGAPFRWLPPAVLPALFLSLSFLDDQPLQPLPLPGDLENQKTVITSSRVLPHQIFSSLFIKTPQFLLIKEALGHRFVFTSSSAC